MKEVPVQEQELAALMDDLESMLADAGVVATKPAETPQVPVATEVSVATEVAPQPAQVETTHDVAAAVTSSTVAVDVGSLPGPQAQEEEIVVPEPATPAVEEPVAPPATKASAAKTPTGRTDPATGLGHYCDPEDFRRDTAISESNMDEAMIHQSGLRAFYGAQAAYAEAQAARVKARFEVIEAKLYDEHRKLLAADPTVKMTEKLVESTVKMDPRWLKAKNLVIEAESIASVNRGLTFAMADRRDMLIQLGADRREEFKGGLRILAGEAEKQSIAERALAAGKRAMGQV